MKDIQVKICGIHDEQAARFAAEAGADYIGFTFVPNHRHTIEPARAAQIVARLKGSVTAVGIFVDERVETVNEIVRRVGLDCVQLHGREPPENCRRIEGAQVIKALSVGDRFTADRVKQLMETYPVDLYVLDRYRQGTGTPVPYELAHEIVSRYSVFLAGRLNPENVAEAVRAVRPYGVDVSSGVETDGRTDLAKIEAFISVAKGVRHDEAVL
ncbi:MAG: N-(5'-phosphoribosyl)anthranilate isomerase [Candidatus Bipolaricaulia bacterium]